MCGECAWIWSLVMGCNCKSGGEPPHSKIVRTQRMCGHRARESCAPTQANRKAPASESGRYKNWDNPGEKPQGSRQKAAGQKERGLSLRYIVNVKYFYFAEVEVVAGSGRSAGGPILSGSLPLRESRNWRRSSRSSKVRTSREWISLSR